MDNIQMLTWRKSQRSIATGECVEVAPMPENVIVRDSKDPGGPVLAYSAESWRAFTLAAHQGYFDTSNRRIANAPVR
jgi:hypothetical protein